MKVLTLDLSFTSTGYAVFEHGYTSSGIPVLNRKNLIKCGKINPLCNNEKRMMYIYDYIHDLIIENRIDVIVIEDGFSGPNKKVGLQLSELRGCIKLLAMKEEKEFIAAPPQKVKKIICKDGPLTKEEVARKLCIHYGGNEVFDKIGPFSDKANKNKTSDIYDAIALYEYYKTTFKEYQTINIDF